MTKEEIRQEALKAEKEGPFPRCAGDKKNSFHGVNSAYGLGFVDGAMWACDKIGSPWISVKDDRPCDYPELILEQNSDKEQFTKDVVGVVHGIVAIIRMIKSDGIWMWENYLPDYWFPVPELPKEMSEEIERIRSLKLTIEDNPFYY